MATVAELTKDGDFKISGNINTRLPVITDGLIAHYPFDGTVQKYFPSQIRYIRDHLSNGSTANGSNHWVEVKAMDYNGNNVALNKLAYAGEDESLLCPTLVDGSIDANQWSTPNMSGVSNHRTIDLGGYYSLKEIIVWHYYPGRTYYKNKTEVSSDGIDWYAVFDGAIEGDYPETSAGHKIDLTNLGATCMPIINTNTTLTSDGIAIEEATTNVSINDGQQGTSPWNGDGNPSLSIIDNYISYRNKKVARYITGSSGNCYINGSTKISTAISSTAWTSSCYIKRVDGLPITSIGGYLYVSGNTNVNGNAIIEDCRDGWYRVSFTRTGLVSGYPTLAGFYSLGTLTEYLFVDWQIEPKAFATSYTKESRAAGRINIPFPLKPPYTINLTHTPSVTLNTVANQATSPMIFQLNEYHTNASISFWNYVKNLTVYIKGDTGSGWSTSKNYHSFTPEFWDSKEHTYTFIAVDNRTFRAYIDGIYLGEQISSVDVTSIEYLSIGNTSMPNARYKDLSIYNRALSDEEVNQLAKSTFELKPNGDLITNKIITKPAIPNDAIYFPLGSDGKDESKAITPNTEANLSYLDGGVWVGHATTNIGATTMTPYAPYGSVVQSPGLIKWTMTSGYLTLQNGVDHNGKIITLSGYMFKNGKPHRLPGDRANTYHTVPAIKWHFDPITGYFEIVENCNASSVWLFHTAPGAATGDVITIVDFQVEERPYATPFVYGTRGVTDLEYNFNQSIGLDWSGNWTIAYWKKPIGTASANLFTGYSIESLGSNSNSVGGGYLWWGKNSGVNSLSGASDGSIDPSWYFGNWHFVVLRKNGTTLTIDTYLPNGKKATRIVSVTTTSPNFYVNHHGYDFKFGWDNANVNNSYYKDLMVAKRSLTDEEISEIYNNKMIQNKDGSLQIQNSIITGQVL